MSINAADMTYLEIWAKELGPQPGSLESQVLKLIEHYKETETMEKRIAELEESLKDTQFGLEYAQRDIADMQGELEELREAVEAVQEVA